MSTTIKKAYNIFDSFTYFFKIIFSDKYLEEEENIIAFKKKNVFKRTLIYKILSTDISTR